MPAPVAHRRIAPSPATASVVEALFASERDHDAPHIGMPRPEIELVVRFGPAARGGLDAHAMGARQRVHRKTVVGVRRTVAARFRLGAAEAALGVPATDLAGRIVALEDLWGAAAAERVFEQLASASDAVEAAAILDRAIAERLATTNTSRRFGSLASAAAGQLRAESRATANVGAIADELGVSERHLRRVFREAYGVAPKTFAKLARFHRALGAARLDQGVGWASIAAGAGYYDQAHLIAEFRAIAGVTPRALLGELGAAVP